MSDDLKKDKTQFFMAMVQKDIKENRLDTFFEQGKLKSKKRPKRTKK